ncbi:MAG TPA: FAD-binding oxidoreductase [Pseudonocardiaceae bacterium]
MQNNHTETTARPIAIGELVTRVRGPVFRPGDDGYDTELAGFQTALRHRPTVVVGATDAADVQAAVRFAADHGLPVAVQATGHGLAVPAEGGVLVSTRRMTRVRVDPQTRTAWVEAGACWEPVITEAARHGLAPLSGSSPQVGAVSYTLNGGLGLLARRYGYAADHVRALDLVTADGRRHRVTPDGDPELFWALCGGPGGLGVVTALEIGLVPVDRLYGGGLYFDATAAHRVLTAWREWTDTVPEELTSSVAFVPYPDVPEVPEEMRGRYVAHVRIAFTGDPETGERLVAPLRTAGPLLRDTLGELPYTASGSICHDPTQPHPYRGDGVVLRDLDAATAEELLGLTGPGAPGMCVVQAYHLGGALARPPAVPNAVAYRDGWYLVRVLWVGDPGLSAAVETTHRRALAALEPQALGRALRFTMGWSDAERVRAAYPPDDLARLARVKATHDPGNVFRFTHAVPPADQR